MAAVAPAAGDDLSTILKDDSTQKDTTHDRLTRNPSGLSDSELDARLAFLEERLDDGENYAKYWQWGWTGGYGLGVVIGVTQSITCCSNKKSGPANSVKKKRNEQRVTHYVTAVKGAIGTTRMLLMRHPGLLQDVAKSAERRWSWKAHAGNIGLNLAGAGFIFGFGRESDAWESLGIGIGVGTLQILSAPKRGIQDLEDYETRFGMKTASRFNWSIVPMTGGAALKVTF